MTTWSSGMMITFGSSTMDSLPGSKCFWISHASDKELIDGIVDLILETVLCRQEYILVASNQYPAEIVRSKFLKLNYSHIEYVLESLRRNTTKVTNIRKYLLAVLFNAPSTMEGYYQAAVQHDMPQLALAK